MAEQNAKKKVPDVSDSNQSVETICSSKLKFAELKRFIHQKGAEKKVNNESCKYVANTAILKLWIFSGSYHFRSWVFAST